MKEKTIFERVDCQNRIWKTGLYDYLYKSVFSVRFAIAAFFIRQFFENGNGIILDVGAGSGTLLTYCNDIVKKYYYNDISEEAQQIFQCSQIYQENESKIKLLCDNINDINLDTKFDSIVALGVARHIYDKDTFLTLFNDNLSANGIMLIETTAACDAFQYYCNGLPNPVHSIKYEILDNFEFGTSKTRILNIYRK